MVIDWDNLIMDPPTAMQRRALYRMGVSRNRVAMLQSSKDADQLIKTLLKTDPRNSENKIKDMSLAS